MTFQFSELDVVISSPGHVRNIQKAWVRTLALKPTIVVDLYWVFLLAVFLMIDSILFMRLTQRIKPMVTLKALYEMYRQFIVEWDDDYEWRLQKDAVESSRGQFRVVPVDLYHGNPIRIADFWAESQIVDLPYSKEQCLLLNRHAVLK